MGLPTPDDNFVGYQKAQLLNKVEGLRDKEYFLIHGTLDDNVHYQQSMLLSKVLEENDILFRQQVRTFIHSFQRLKALYPCIICFSRATLTKITVWPTCARICITPWRTSWTTVSFATILNTTRKRTDCKERMENIRLVKKSY